MAQVHNVSDNPLGLTEWSHWFGAQWAGPPHPGQEMAVTIAPHSIYNSPTSDGKPAAFYLFVAGEWPQQFWCGMLRATDVVAADPVAGTVHIASASITQDKLNALRRLHPGDAAMQSVSIDQLANHALGRDPWGNKAVTNEVSRARRGDVTACAFAIGGVVVDVMLTIWGASGLYNKIGPAVVEDVARIAEHELAAIEEIAKVLSNPDASTIEKAGAIKDIGLLIYSGGMLEAIFKAIVGGLTWWDMALYGTIGLGELTAAFLTDGALLVAMLVIEVSQAGFVISDSVKAMEACSSQPSS
jgi:hypothetical protein